VPGGLWLVIELGRDIMPTNIFTQFDKDRMKTDLQSGNPYFGQFKGDNSRVPGRLWLVIELGQDIMPTNIFTKLNKDQMKTL